MKNQKFLLIILLTIFVGIISCSKDDDPAPDNIWNESKITFTKIDGADWTLEANQDRITSNVWITRANSKGIFNIKIESTYEGSDDSGSSPHDTEWAFGTTTDLSTLNFGTWAEKHDGYPGDLVGEDMVMHLITDNIYIDIKFLTWSSGGDGGQGGFSYIRGTK
ncbi:hypothetical protein ACFLSE_07420, partial [Bacteroidota bacterium]